MNAKSNIMRRIMCLGKHLDQFLSLSLSLSLLVNIFSVSRFLLSGEFKVSNRVCGIMYDRITSTKLTVGEGRNQRG